MNGQASYFQYGPHDTERYAVCKIFLAARPPSSPRARRGDPNCYLISPGGRAIFKVTSCTSVCKHGPEKGVEGRFRDHLADIHRIRFDSKNSTNLAEDSSSSTAEGVMKDFRRVYVDFGGVARITDISSLEMGVQC